MAAVTRTPVGTRQKPSGQCSFGARCSCTQAQHMLVMLKNGSQLVFDAQETLMASLSAISKAFMKRLGISSALASKAYRSDRRRESDESGAMPLPLFNERAKCVNPYLSPLGFSLHCTWQHTLSASHHMYSCSQEHYFPEQCQEGCLRGTGQPSRAPLGARLAAMRAQVRCAHCTPAANPAFFGHHQSETNSEERGERTFQSSTVGASGSGAPSASHRTMLRWLFQAPCSTYTIRPSSSKMWPVTCAHSTSWYYMSAMPTQIGR